ncbi:O-antigen ligase family protein [Robertkochia solimangrovi]|uniref:O-antigen ligase family protein n=1 Tax=Robertkochia solimangrovi TaxID=2213046 RepID=UPI00117DAE26|nr:O-antigen ligase family protein [Robertkochia solimangrovi]TRZ45016.1 hypothetical protein DMZ48_04440 [Robertkochia solimangrovi]
MSTIEKIYFWGLALLFLLCLLDPLGKGFAFGYLLAIGILVNPSTYFRYIDKSALLLGAATIAYALFYSLTPQKGTQFILIYALFPVSFYLYARYLATKKYKEWLLYAFFFTFFIFSLIPLVTVLENIRTGGYLQLERNLPLLGTGIIVSATKMGSFFTMHMCIPAVILIYRFHIKKWMLFLLIGLYVLSLLCILRIGSRTQLLITAITIFIALGYIFPKIKSSQRIGIIGFLGVIIAVIITQINFSMDATWMTAFSDRMEGSTNDMYTAGSRTERWSRSFEYLFSHPFGWSVDEFGFSHNLWLDVLREGGVICFFLLVIYSLASLKNIYNFLIKKNIDFRFRALLAIYLSGFYLVFMVEPIFEGMFTFFSLSCFVQGIVNTYQKNEEFNRN